MNVLGAKYSRVISLQIDENYKKYSTNIDWKDSYQYDKYGYQKAQTRKGF